MKCVLPTFYQCVYRVCFTELSPSLWLILVISPVVDTLYNCYVGCESATVKGGGTFERLWCHLSEKLEEEQASVVVLRISGK